MIEDIHIDRLTGGMYIKHTVEMGLGTMTDIEVS
jgi:hypothetical protein